MLTPELNNYPWIILFWSDTQSKRTLDIRVTRCEKNKKMKGKKTYFYCKVSGVVDTEIGIFCHGSYSYVYRTVVTFRFQL